SPDLGIECGKRSGGDTERRAIGRIRWSAKRGMVAVEATKSGSPKQENVARHLGIFRFEQKAAYDIDLTHGRYWFTKVDRGSNWVDLTRYTRERLTEDYQKVDRIIQEDLLLPNPGENCTLCDVKPWCREMGWLKPGEEL